MPSLMEILNDPNYVDANEATKQAIFDKYSSVDQDYLGANDATKAAIRQRFGIAPPPSAGIGTYAGDVAKQLGAGIITGSAGAPEAIEAGLQEGAKETAFLPTEIVNTIASPTKLANKITSAFGVPPIFAEQKAQEIIPQKVAEAQKLELDKALARGKIPQLREITEAGAGVAKSLQESVSPEMKRAMAMSTPSGNLLEALDTGDFSKLSFGQDPSALGLLGHAANVFGSAAPAIFGAVITKKPSVAAGIGFGQAASEGVQTARDYIDTMPDEELYQKSPYFKQLVDAGTNPKEARKLTEAKAGDTAALYQGLVGMLGGEFTGKLVTGQLDKALIGSVKSRLGKIVALTGVAGAEEGAQEMAEGIATDLGINKSVVKKIGADSFANLVLGAMGGFGPGTVRGAVAQTSVAPTPQVQPEEPTIAPTAATKPPAEQEVTVPPASTYQDVAASLAALKGKPLETPKELAAEADTAKDVIIQNRNRATPASIQQMNQIAANLDYDLVGFSKEFQSGSPVVAGDFQIPAAQLGKKQTATAQDGSKIPVQYAVVDAKDVLPSNNADGSVNKDFFKPDYPGLKAIAGNGRTAGIQAAYDRDTAKKYKEGLLADDLHGVSKEAIESIENPMLVRVMPKSAITKNIGDISNVASNLNLSTVEQAKNDANRIDIAGLKYNENGDIDPSAIRGFIASMPFSEQANLIDDNGQPTRQAVDRLNAAIFQQAYGNDELTRIAHQAEDTEAKNIIKALAEAAPKMARLEGAGDYDIRPQLLEAAQLAINARRNNVKLSDLVAQKDMTVDELSNALLAEFAQNIRSSKKIADRLSNLADLAYEQTQQASEDIFGEKPKMTREQLVEQGMAPTEEPGLFEKATPFADKFIAEEKELARRIRAALNKMGLRDVGVNLEDALEAYSNGKMSRVNGIYFNKLIRLSLSGDNIFRSMNHEALHAMKDLGFFSAKDWALLSDKAEKVWMKKYDIANPDNYGQETKEIQIEEAIAHAFADYQTETPTIKTMMTKAINALKRIGNVFKGLGFNTAEDIFQKAGEGKFAAEAGVTPTAQPRYELGKSTKAKPKTILGKEVPVEQQFKKLPKTAFQEKLDNVRYALQDKYIDLKRIQQSIIAAGRTIDEEQDAYLKQEAYATRSATRLENYVKDYLTPLLKELRKNKISVPDFEHYLHNRTAEERNKIIANRNPEDPSMQDGGSGINTQDARDYLAAIPAEKKKVLEALADRVYKMTKVTQDLLVDTGIEPKEKIEGWVKSNPHYVPLFREETDYEGSNFGTGAGFSSRGNFSKPAVGSKRPVVDILANIAMQYERAVKQSEKARVGRALIGMALLNPMPKFWMPINPTAITDPEAAVKQLESIGLSADEAANLIAEPEEKYTGTFLKKRFADFKDAQQYAKDIGGFVEEETQTESEYPFKVMKQEVRTRVNPANRFGPYVLPVRVDGKDWFLAFNQQDADAKRMAEALKNMDVESVWRPLQMIGKATRFFASINTQYNPIFGILNFVRDFSGSMVNLGSTPLAGKQTEVATKVIPALMDIYSDLRSERKTGKPATGEYAKLYEELKLVGGTVGFTEMFGKSDSNADIIQRELEKLDRGNARKAADAAFNWLSDYNNAIENAMRVSVYKTGLDNGLSKERAASVAKNITVNFNRRGAKTQTFNSLFAFFNAALQGTARLAETLTTQQPDGSYKLSSTGKKVIGGGILLGVMQAIALAAAGFGDDEPPEFVKQKNLVIPTGEKSYVAIPLPLGLHIFPNVGRMTMEYVLSGGKNGVKKLGQFMGATMDAFNPLGGSGLQAQTFTPTFADPIVAIMENRDAFGRNIAKEDRGTKPSPGYTRYRDTASEISKQVSYFLNMASGGTKYTKGLVSPTPDQLDFLIGQLTGGVGREALKAEQAVSSIISGEELPPYKIPLAGRFYGNLASQAAVSSKFYENVTKLSEYEDEIKGRIKDKEGYQDFLDKHPEAKLWSAANNMENQISQINRTIRDLKERNADPATIKRLQESKTRMMDNFNKKVIELEK